MANEERTKGWEVAQELEEVKRTIWERFVPEKRQLMAALWGLLALFGVFLIAYCTNLYFLNWTVALVFFVLLSFTFALSIRMIPMRRMIQVIKYE